MTPRAGFAAAHLAGCVRGGDNAGRDRLLAKLTPRDIREVVELLAGCADWPRLNAATGYVASSTPRELHAWHERLRSSGMARGQMPAHVLAGEREYQRLAKAAQRARRNAEQIPA